ncbi:MAG: carboxypeptidase regulatory-like domain-containing protein [Candidatus Bathyarchaeota archaeon]|nr:MAG: carboxypeptidase regulatory-like domain-containing protein [Candidatus Bathyarchaeota archaeon]
MTRKKLLFLFIFLLFTFNILAPLNLTIARANAIETHDISVLKEGFEVNGYQPPWTIVKDAVVPIAFVVKNNGTVTETFNVTVYYNDTFIEMETVSNLTAKTTTSLTFAWNTVNVMPGAYKINVTASSVPGETDTKNNTIVSPTVKVISSSMILSHVTVIPQSTVNENLTPGDNYTVSIYTDYNGSDITTGQLTLSYNPNILHGGINKTDTWIGDNVTKTFGTTGTPVVPNSEKVYVNQVLMTKPANYTIDYDTGVITFTTAPDVGAAINANYYYGGVVNGDLITTDKHPSAMFNAGNFNNTSGELELTAAFFLFFFPPAPITSGPGTLANITFTVVGTGESNIILGPETMLIGVTDNGNGDDYNINAELNPSYLQHGYFKNAKGHDIAVTSLTAPAEVSPGDFVSINVTVANEGIFPESSNVTVYANETEIGTQSVTDLAALGNRETLTFSWNTTGLTEGNYIINATATQVPGETDINDNTKTIEIQLKKVHDVAVVKVEVPDKAVAGTLFIINVTVANEGNYEENVNLTVSYGERLITPPYWIELGIINSTIFTLAQRPASTTISLVWNTTVIYADMIRTSRSSYNSTINATANISPDNDEDPDDNKNTTGIVEFSLGPDVKISSLILEAKPKNVSTEVFIGELAIVKVKISNRAKENVTLEVKVTYDTHIIGTQTLMLPPESTNYVSDITGNSFTWDTTGLNPGTYTIRAEAILDGDPKPKDNHMSVEINVKFQLGTIAGTVTNAFTGDPMENATVIVNGHSVTTNTEGQYTVQLPPGTYTVTTTANGYKNSSKTNITVVANETTSVDFELTPIQPLNILLYAGVAAIAIIITVTIAVYLLKFRKPT